MLSPDDRQRRDEEQGGHDFYVTVLFGLIQGTPRQRHNHEVAILAFRDCLTRHERTQRHFAHWRASARSIAEQCWGSSPGSPIPMLGAISRAVQDDVDQFVQEELRLHDLGLPWLHFAVLLTDAFAIEIIAEVAQRRGRSEYQVLPAPIPMAPHIQFGFETQQGESLEQATTRFRREIARVTELFEAAKLRDLPPDRGRRPHDDATRLRVEWFYRAKLCGQSIRSIAKQNFFDRRTVQEGIQKAHDLLSS